LVKARNILVQYDYDNPLESGDQVDSVVDLLFLPEKCFTSKSVLLLMKLVHGALKVCLPTHYFLLLCSIHLSSLTRITTALFVMACILIISYMYQPMRNAFTIPCKFTLPAFSVHEM